MNFLADESVDHQVVDHLRRDGHQVWYVAEMEPGIPDDAVLALANQRNALLLTADKDFGEMVFRQRLHTQCNKSANGKALPTNHAQKCPSDRYT